MKEIFAAAHTHKLVRNGNGTSAGEGNGGNSSGAGAQNPRATLCKIPFQLIDCANQLLLGLSFILAAGSSEPSLPVACSSCRSHVHLIPTFISFPCSSHPCVRLHPHIRHLHVLLLRRLVWLISIPSPSVYYMLNLLSSLIHLICFFDINMGSHFSGFFVLVSSGKSVK